MKRELRKKVLNAPRSELSAISLKSRAAFSLWTHLMASITGTAATASSKRLSDGINFIFTSVTRTGARLATLAGPLAEHK
jgi:hypothetical protein